MCSACGSSGRLCSIVYEGEKEVSGCGVEVVPTWGIWRPVMGRGKTDLFVEVEGKYLLGFKVELNRFVCCAGKGESVGSEL